MKASKFKNILVAQTAFLGDMVLTTPLFKALRRLYPEARITLLTTPAAAPLAAADPNLDGMVLYDKNGKESFLSALRKIRAGDHDLFIAPHRSFRTSLLGFFSEIPVRIGYGEAGFSFLYTRKVRRPMEMHEVDRILALLEALPAETIAEDRVLRVDFTEVEKAEVDRVLNDAGVSPDERLIGLAPGSVWFTKRWLPEGFAAVGRALAERGYRVVLLGGPGDREVADQVLGALGPGAVDAVGKTSLKALGAWVDRFEGFVTNDSAPLHVAAARNTPTVAIFGATVRELGFSPFHSLSRVVEIPLPCRPCGSHGGDSCPKGHFDCMKKITPETVLAALDGLMGEAK